MEGDRGAGARENRGRRGTGDGRRKGGRRDLYDGGKRERNSKRQSFAICYSLLPVKEFNVFRGLQQNVIHDRSQKTKIRARDKKNGITSCEIGNLSKSPAS